MSLRAWWVEKVVRVGYGESVIESYKKISCEVKC